MSKLEKTVKAIEKGVKVIGQVEKRLEKSKAAPNLRKDHITPKNPPKTHENQRGRAKHTRASGRTIEYRDGIIEPPRTKEIMTAWDKMTLAKLSPGNTNPQYVAGMNVTQVPTMTFSVTNTLESCYMVDIDSSGQSTFTIQPIGTAPYLFLFWIPAATAYHGPGGGGYISTSDKLGGLSVIQVTAAAMATPQFNTRILISDFYAKTMVEVYGSDMEGFSEGGFVWAAQADFKIVTPEANLIGAMMRGNLTWGQVPVSGPNALSGNQLFKIAQDAEVTHDFHMRSSVFNNNILFDSQSIGGNANDPHFASEVLNYVIIQQGAGSITTGGNIPYSLIFNIRGNGAFWQNPFDSLANNLFTNNVTGVASASPGVLSGIEPNSLNNVKKPNGSHKLPFMKQVGNAFKSAGKFLWDHKSQIMTGFEAVAPMLLAEPIPDQQQQIKVRTADYLYRLGRVQRTLAKLDGQSQDTIPIIAQLIKLVNYEAQYQSRVGSSFTTPTQRMCDAEVTFTTNEHELAKPTQDGSLTKGITQATANEMIRRSNVRSSSAAPALTASQNEQFKVFVQALRKETELKAEADSSRIVDLFDG